MRTNEQHPSNNIYNIFTCGKTYFLKRTLIELFAWLIFMVGCFILFLNAMIMPTTVVRTETGDVFLGKPKVYSPTVSEILRTTKTLIEGPLLITSAPTKADSIIMELVTPTCFESLKKWPRPAHLQKARVVSLFLESAWNDPKLNLGQMVIYVQIELLKIGSEKTPVLFGYYKLTYDRYDNRTQINPTGWRLNGLEELSMEYFVAQREKILGRDFTSTQKTSVIDLSKDI